MTMKATPTPEQLTTITVISSVPAMETFISKERYHMKVFVNTHHSVKLQEGLEDIKIWMASNFLLLN